MQTYKDGRLLPITKSSHAKSQMLCPFRLVNLVESASCVAERCMCWVNVGEIMNLTNQEEGVGYCSFHEIGEKK